MEKSWGINRILQASGGNTSSTGNGNMGDAGGDGQDTYEFVAFLLWYLFLVLCCIVPTCCAYRRRRMVESRLAQHHFDLARLQQQQMNGHPNFLLLDQISAANPHARRNNEEYRRIRKEKIGETLQPTTLMLADHDIETLIDEVDGTALDVAMDDYFGDLDESTARVKLPADAANGNRSVPGMCAICLCPYSAGERITWSPKTACQHAFHKDCIIQWLAKKEELKCPVCRQDYCESILMDDVFPVSEDMFLDSFALALNYARSHASRSWANDVGRSSGTGPFALTFEPPVRVHVMGGNNDLSLRDHSEGMSQDIEMGAVHSDSIADQLPEATADIDDAGEVEIEGLAVSNRVNIAISDNREQSPESTIETSNDGESEREEIGQPPDTTVQTDHDREIETEEVALSETDITAGPTGSRER